MDNDDLYELEQPLARPAADAAATEKATHSRHSKLVEKYNRLLTLHMRSRGWQPIQVSTQRGQPRKRQRVDADESQEEQRSEANANEGQEDVKPEEDPTPVEDVHQDDDADRTNGSSEGTLGAEWREQDEAADAED